MIEIKLTNCDMGINFFFRTFYSNVDLSQKYRSEGESSVLSTPHHGDSRDDYYSHYEDLNERVRSPSLPPIDRGGGKNR